MVDLLQIIVLSFNSYLSSVKLAPVQTVWGLILVEIQQQLC